ncbi:LOW QUALITY PROTEIN: hypothetical protein PanWU01x14_307530, partial [Parasponia andersonii]
INPIKGYKICSKRLFGCLCWGGQNEVIRYSYIILEPAIIPRVAESSCKRNLDLIMEWELLQFPAEKTSSSILFLD